jgi:secondary thiamine-phosphate synthase enzyme
MNIFQTEITLPRYKRGFHLITRAVEDALPKDFRVRHGLCHLLIKHTSASLTLNENADPDVRVDMETFFNALVPESFRGFTHTSEGSDDMPAHIKSSLFGASLIIPVTAQRLNLGTWQGIYLCEHRDYGGPRRIVLTLLYDS